MGLYTALIANGAFPLHERLKGHGTTRIRRALEQSQWFDAQRLNALRVRRLRELLDYAQAHVPFYRDLFAQVGFDPHGVDSLDALRALPLLDKALIRANSERLKSEQAQQLSRFSTGGSSGEPLLFYIGKERVSHDVAAKWRATRWWDVDIGDPEIVVWGSPIELKTQDRVRAVRDRLFRTELLPAFDLSDAKLDSFIARIRQVRPRMLFGYPSALAMIANRARQRCVPMDELGIRVAFVTAERLYDEQRESIAKVFGCAVANGYGGRDAGFIAHQCPAGGMHITAEDVIVEIIDADGHVLPAGEQGEIVVTHLATRDFPFIRYRTGDVASIDPQLCSCGRTLPLLKDIQGRSTDFVKASDGTVMHGLALIYVLRELQGIDSFKIVQENLHHTRVLLVPGPGYNEAVAEQIVSGLQRRLGTNVDIGVECVPALPAERSGKMRYVLSHIDMTQSSSS